MATAFEELLASTQTEDTSTEEVLPTKGTATAGDYLLDVVRAPVKGASKAVQGLLQLGVLPIDYLANTNLINGIDDIFNKITPDTKTGIGDIAATLVQYGAPLGVATKLAGGSFEVNLHKTKKIFSIGPNQTILQVLQKNGISAPGSCEQGICGTCETHVLDGIPDHRDSLLSAEERSSNKVMMICCSRSLSPSITLDL